MSNIKEYLLDHSSIKEPISQRDIEEYNTQFISEYQKMEQILKDQSERGPGISVFDNLFKPMGMALYRRALYFAEDIMKKSFSGGLVSIKKYPSFFHTDIDQLKETILPYLYFNDKNVLLFNDEKMVVRYGSDFDGCSLYIDYTILRGVEHSDIPQNLEFKSKWGF